MTSPRAATVGNYDVNFSSPGRESSNTTFASSKPPYSTLSSQYQTLLSSGITTFSSGGTMTLTISGLTNGQGYLIQWWANDADFAGTNPGDISKATSTNSVSLLNNSGGFDGSPGQFVTGTFTANASGSEQITFEGFNTAAMSTRAILSGFELRTAVVPEPSTLAMGTVGLLCLSYYDAAADSFIGCLKQTH